MNAMNPCRTSVGLFPLFVKTRSLFAIAELDALNNIQRTHGAGYECRGRRGCLEGTRKSLLETIELWAQNFEDCPIFWLSGLAGTGKSAIAQTVAEWCSANGKLGASFFFSGDATWQSHDNPGLLFPTLAFQLANKYPEVRSALIPHLRSNPDIAHQSFESQAEKLIIKPLHSVGVSTVIVVDALDECQDKETLPAILSALASIVKTSKVKFFITSRPFPPIKGLKDIARTSSLHDTDHDTQLFNDDIRHFLTHELSGLSTRKGLKNWPTAKLLDRLCDDAAGLFVYAVAIVKFFGQAPRRQCAAFEHSLGDRTCVGKVAGVHRGMSLDSFCISVLQASFATNSAKENTAVHSVLTAALHSGQLSGISKKVGLEEDEVVSILKSVYPLIECSEDTSKPARIFHKQLFLNCLGNWAYHPDECFFCGKSAIASILVWCWRWIAKAFESFFRPITPWFRSPKPG